MNVRISFNFKNPINMNVRAPFNLKNPSIMNVRASFNEKQTYNIYNYGFKILNHIRKEYYECKNIIRNETENYGHKNIDQQYIRPILRN